jgi:hypothetical protein
MSTDNTIEYQPVLSASEHAAVRSIIEAKRLEANRRDQRQQQAAEENALMSALEGIGHGREEQPLHLGLNL